MPTRSRSQSGRDTRQARARRAAQVAPAPGETPARVRGRPKVISDEALLAIAREVFLERGIRATTAEVAERAGIAEGTVFLRFKSKDALFRAAVCVDPGTMPAFVEAFASSAGKGD